MKETLESLGIYRPGLVHGARRSRGRSTTAARSPRASRSNEITFQVAENKEDLADEDAAAAGPGEAAREADPPKKEEGATRGKRAAARASRSSAIPTGSPSAQRVASLVQPIVNPGPTVDKEVSVFEREPGGPAPPLPVAPQAADDTPSRTFLRRPEVPLVPPDLSAEERDVLRRYFDSIRAQKKL